MRDPRSGSSGARRCRPRKFRIVVAWASDCAGAGKHSEFLESDSAWSRSGMAQNVTCLNESGSKQSAWKIVKHLPASYANHGGMLGTA